MEKIDFKKTLKHLYNPRQREFSVVDVPEMQFLMVDGHGDPNTESTYTEAVEALYAVDAFEVDRGLYDLVMQKHPQASDILLQFYKERIVETVMAIIPMYHVRVLGGGLYLVGAMGSFLLALLFGAMLSPTDPVRRDVSRKPCATNGRTMA